MRYTYIPSENQNGTLRHCETKIIRRQTAAFGNEKLSFKDGMNLGDLDIYNESGETRRKVRRIIEKRICQDLYRRSKAASKDNNYGRYNEKHRLSNSLKNLYGAYPSSDEFAA